MILYSLLDPILRVSFTHKLFSKHLIIVSTLSSMYRKVLVCNPFPYIGIDKFFSANFTNFGTTKSSDWLGPKVLKNLNIV